MPKASFYRRMPLADRAALDKEIRRRAYADLDGLASWLSERGYPVGKSVVGNYCKRLRLADESSAPVEFSPECQAAILECAALVIRLLSAIRRISAALDLQGIRDEPDPGAE